MTIRFNAKEAADESFDRSPPGKYVCIVANAEEKMSSKNDPMISLQWKPMGKDFTICWDNLVFNKGGRGIAYKKLKSMGVKLPETGDEVEIEAADLIGLTAVLTLVEKEYKGKKNLTPDFDAEGFGYAPEATPFDPTDPPGAPPAVTASDKKFNEDIPF